MQLINFPQLELSSLTCPNLASCVSDKPTADLESTEKCAPCSSRTPVRGRDFIDLKPVVLAKRRTAEHTRLGCELSCDFRRTAFLLLYTQAREDRMKENRLAKSPSTPWSVPLSATCDHVRPASPVMWSCATTHILVGHVVLGSSPQGRLGLLRQSVATLVGITEEYYYRKEQIVCGNSDLCPLSCAWPASIGY